jgi:hypothetical protein
MAYDDRDERGRARGRGPEWRGDDSFGGGWGNQTPRPVRLGDRNWRGETDDPDYGQERYGGGATWDEPDDRAGGIAPSSFDIAPGYDASLAGPRFDRLDVGSVGTHGVHPVSSMYGGDYSGPLGLHPGGGYGSSARRYAEIRRHGHAHHDPQYSEWRDRQIEQFDRDYDDYRREHQSRFEREFGEWRERRGRQRQALGQVTEHMEVVGSDGSHVGTVDCTSGDSIVLTKSDPNARGHHHRIPCGWVESVDRKVTLNITAEEAMRRWRDAEDSGALFDRGERETARRRADREPEMRGSGGYGEDRGRRS